MVAKTEQATIGSINSQGEISLPDNILQLGDIRLETPLPVGTVIDGIHDLKGFNTVAEVVARKVSGRTGLPMPRTEPLLEYGIQVEPAETDVALRITNSYRQSKYNGRPENFIAAFVDPNLSHLSRGITVVDEENAAEFIAYQDISSTGRGTIGTLATAVLIAPMKIKNGKPKVGVVSRTLNQKMLDDFIARSSAIGTLLLKRSISHPRLSGGYGRTKIIPPSI
ncbi:MAG TPA: hypothetical protein VJC10_02405 [Patescibacteria group bacterium]|nr:hypothetical protein [Patescibacteria group bacterium]